MRSSLAVALLLAACTAHRPAAPAPEARRLVILHASDGESELLPGAEGDGGLASFVALLDGLEARERDPVLRLAAGDTFMPGHALDVRLDDGTNAVLRGNRLSGWHASALGNHEFDRGEAFLAGMIAGSPFPYVTATVSFASGPLAPLALAPPRTAWLHEHPGRLLPRGKLCAGAFEGDRCGGLTVGVVGATTEELRSITSAMVGVGLPSGRAELLALVQAQVDALRAEGIDVIVLLSHLQDVRQELALVEDGLVGVDVILSGGGDDRLADEGDRLHPGDAPSPVCASEAGCYPLRRVARDGAPVVVAATDGQHRYVGRLALAFAPDGTIAAVDADSGPWPVDAASLRAVGAGPDAPGLLVEAAVRGELARGGRVLARVAQELEGDREAVRNRQTNLGDLAADSLAHSARARGRPVDFAIRNAGGIRAAIGPGAIAEADVAAALRFDNPVVVVTTTRRVLAETIEASLRGAGTGRGHFPQVSRELFVAYDPARPEQVQRLRDGEVEGIVSQGRRLRTLRLDRGGRLVPLVEDGVVIEPDARVRFATLDFLARGADGWFPGASSSLSVETLPVRERRAFAEHLAALRADGAWRDGAAYPDPRPDDPASFTRIRALDQ